MQDGRTPVIDALVDFALGLEMASLPPAVIEAAKRSILTRGELEAKFRRLAEVVLPAERVARLVSALRGLADLPDVSEVAALAAG
jgi:hypothetical protein